MRAPRVFALCGSAAAALLLAMPSGARPLSDSSWTSFGHDLQDTGYTDAPLFTPEVKSFAPSGRRR